ncbi:hypothetical protein HDV05_001992, partial [Chytridiales sp. JEL 0842]
QQAPCTKTSKPTDSQKSITSKAKYLDSARNIIYRHPCVIGLWSWCMRLKRRGRDCGVIVLSRFWMIWRCF